MRQVRCAVLAILALACCARATPATSPAPPRTTVAALGESLTLQSEVLGEQRVINVYVPPDYATSGARYPVLYMPDGGMAEDFPHVVGSVDVSIKNAVIRPVIVVGIENTERRRDLVGPTAVADEQKAAPLAGGADRFRQFLREELKPLIERRYRTAGESAIVGESLAGLFVVETMVVEPSLFHGYIAADPSVWWNQFAVIDKARHAFAGWTARGARQLYVATADHQEMIDGVTELTTLLRIHAPPGVTWTYEPMPHEQHSTIYPTAALHGIRTLFAAPPVTTAH